MSANGRSIYPRWLAKHLPFRGPCGLCGGPDARHRMVDAIKDRVCAGESVDSIAADYSLPVAFVRRVAVGLVEQPGGAASGTGEGEA